MNDNTSTAHSSRIGKQFLTLLDLIHQNNLKILIIGTTSNIEMVDLSLRRPGRFENEVHNNNILELLFFKIYKFKKQNFNDFLIFYLDCSTIIIRKRS